MSLIKKLQKNCTSQYASILNNSILFNSKDVISTPIPALNVALSGRLDGGLTSGITTIAGVSRNFKTGFSLTLAKSFLDKYDDGVILFYDSEFGSPQSYFRSFDIDLNRVLHVPITNIEELKFDIVTQLQAIERDEHVLIIIDSLGNLSSTYELDKALKGESTVDLTRAKSLKSLFRMITPQLTIKDIPLIVINHVYSTLELFSKTIVGGGSGSIYSSDTILIIGRQQDKDGTELAGYNFVINVDKSRYVKEKSKIPITVSFEHGIQKYSGLLDIAVEGGFVEKGRVGRSLGYAKIDKSTGVIDKMVSAAKANTEEFWEPLLSNLEFREYIKKKYEISYGHILHEESLEDSSEEPLHE